METTLLSVGSRRGSKEMSSQTTKRHGGNFIAYYKVKGGDLKVYVLYDFSYMTFWEKANCTDRKRVNGYQRLGGTNSQSTGEF